MDNVREGHATSANTGSGRRAFMVMFVASILWFILGIGTAFLNNGQFLRPSDFLKVPWEFWLYSLPWLVLMAVGYLARFLHFRVNDEPEDSP